MHEISSKTKLTSIQLIGSTGLKIHGLGDIDIISKSTNRNWTHNLKQLTTYLGSPSHSNNEMTQWKCDYKGYPIEFDLMRPFSPRYEYQAQLFGKLFQNQQLKLEYAALKTSCNGLPTIEYYLARCEWFLSKRLDAIPLFPTKIHDFAFFKLVDVSNNSPFAYALYKDQRGNSAFAKACVYHNVGAKELDREIAFYRGLQAGPSNQRVKFPRFIDSIETKKIRLLLLEHISAKSINGFELKTKVSAIVRALEFLQTLPIQLPIPQLPGWKWVLSFPLITLKALVFHPMMIILILKTTRQFVRLSPKVLGNSTLVFCHRDLSVWNIMRSVDAYWIIDFQLACLAHPVVDLAVLLHKTWNEKKLFAGLVKSAPYKTIFHSKEHKNLFIAYALWIGVYNLSSSLKEERIRSKQYLYFLLEL
jgi:hypothetical protein